MEVRWETRIAVNTPVVLLFYCFGPHGAAKLLQWQYHVILLVGLHVHLNNCKFVKDSPGSVKAYFVMDKYIHYLIGLNHNSGWMDGWMDGCTLFPKSLWRLTKSNGTGTIVTR